VLPQVVAAQRLLLKQHRKYYYARKAALACLHDMGFGTRYAQFASSTHVL
jgi:hypothetical protein